MPVISLPLDRITRDPTLQPRESMSEERMQEYVEILLNAQRNKLDNPFPPVDVFYDGKMHWLADGWHRFAAHQAVGYAAIASTVHDGEYDDALRFSLGANATHGLPRTRGDKRRAVLRAMQHKDLCKWSHRKLAVLLKCSSSYVANVRQDVRAAAEKDNMAESEVAAEMASEGDRPVYVTPASTYDVPEESRLHDDALIAAQEAFAGVPGRIGTVQRALGRVDMAIVALQNETSALLSKEVAAQIAKPHVEGYFKNISNQLRQVKRELKMFKGDMANGQPYAICHHCHGEGCRACSGKGWLSKQRYEAGQVRDS